MFQDLNKILTRSYQVSFKILQESYKDLTKIFLRSYNILPSFL